MTKKGAARKTFAPGSEALRLMTEDYRKMQAKQADEIKGARITESLIRRLEWATGPDLELDFAIYRAVYDEDIVKCRHYTASIDAALALLEPGWEFSISTMYGIAHVELPLNDTRIGTVVARLKSGDVAIALCIAALRARFALTNSPLESHD